MRAEFAARLGFEFISAHGQAPAAFATLAAKLGYPRIGLAPAPITGPLVSDPAWSLRNDPAGVRALKKALADNGVRITLGEGFIILPGRDIAAAEADVDLMAELGAERLNACAMEPDASRNRDQFAMLAAMAATRGLPVTVEFMPASPIPDLAAGLAFVAGSGATNAGVLVDAMHLFCSGGTAADLRAVAPALVNYAQLCDAKQASFYDGYYQDARYNRLLPGEGVLPLEDFIAALPADCPIGLEAPMVRLAEAGIGHEARLRRALAATETSFAAR